MNVHRRLDLTDQFPGLGVIQAEEASVIATCRDEPLSIRRKLHLLDESFVFTVFDLMDSFPLLPVEDFDP